MIFTLGSRIRLTETFTDLIAGAPADPTTVTLKLHDPTGVETVFSYANGDITRDGIGVYHYDFTPTVTGSLNAPWIARWIATGTVVAADEQKFNVAKSGFTTP